MNREIIYEYAEKTYQTLPEYLWTKHPKDAVLRHKQNQKWYTVIMNVPKKKFGLDGSDEIDVMNIKCDPDMIGSLRMTKGFFPAYHMNKENWISVALDGSVEEELLFHLLDISYEQTAGKKRKA